MAQERTMPMTITVTGCGFDSHLFKFIFSFLRYDVMAKCGDEFPHATRNVSRIRWKMENGVS